MLTTRDRILDAAAEIMRTRGIVRATTREIARVAGFSEATLYKHFRDKEELLLHVLQERLPSFTGFTDRPGEGTVEDNLLQVARGALAFYHRTFPMLGSVLAEPRFMAAHRESLRKYDAGPERPIARLSAYLKAEQELGRVSAGADPDAAAALLLGACFQQAFLRHYAEGPEVGQVPESTAVALARTIARSILP
ncbi:MAG TPA: helix-turn-helix domain-containing protein [Actinomadura sp.]|jgi:AcrR family transcriptional regulator|nr:helix-turn-helix domain-containing protein [Actinomadura sp.]